MKLLVIIFTLIYSLAAEEIYDAYFTIIWDNNTHPHPDGEEAFPDGPSGAYMPHFSPIIGAVHNDNFILWREGSVASSALKQCAETGGTSEFSALINSAISNETAKVEFSTAGGPSPSTLDFSFTTSDGFPLVSFTSMIAPSPDWFFGLSSYSLKEEGEWIDSVSIPLYPFDAGTKDGDEYSFSFPTTEPPTSVWLRRNFIPFSDNPVAEIKLVRQKPVALEKSALKKNGIVDFLGNSQGKLHYSIRESGDIIHSIYALNGVELSRERIGYLQGGFYVETSGFARGVYISQISVNGIQMNNRFVLK